MPNIFQVRTVFSGFSGAPGYNQMYFNAGGGAETPQQASDHVLAFWNAVAVAMPSGTHFNIDADVEELVDSTGALVTVHPTTPGSQSVFGDGAAYAGGVGACVGWITGAVHRAHRLRGRSFIVPLNSGAYDVDGTITSIQLGRIRTAATALVTTAQFGVWGRPVSHANGLFAIATATNTRDKTAVLRSRRD